MAPLEPDQVPKLAPFESDVGTPAGEVHRIVGAIATADEFLDPVMRIIVDAEKFARGAGKARMIEQGEVMEAELEGGIAEHRAERRQIGARVGGLSEAVAEPPHRPRLATMAFARCASTAS